MSKKLLSMEERIKLTRKWAARMKKITNRKRDPKSEAQFCRDHGICPRNFNFSKNLHQIPKQATIELVEAALAAEGV